jgi:hypothetical protein
MEASPSLDRIPIEDSGGCPALHRIAPQGVFDNDWQTPPSDRVTSLSGTLPAVLRTKRSTEILSPEFFETVQYQKARLLVPTFCRAICECHGGPCIRVPAHARRFCRLSTSPHAASQPISAPDSVPRPYADDARS